MIGSIIVLSRFSECLRLSPGTGEGRWLVVVQGEYPGADGLGFGLAESLEYVEALAQDDACLLGSFDVDDGLGGPAEDLGFLMEITNIPGQAERDTVLID
ncbi:MAG TPA: hypothetical protein VGG25_11420, partial [Streptosporangiaceae bacterium]